MREALRLMRTLLLKRAPLLLAVLALSSQAAPPENELSLGMSMFAFGSFFRGAGPFTGLEATYHRPVASEGFWSAVRIGGGLRTGFPSQAAFFPLEAFVQAQLTAHLGPWEAAAGPELGIGGYARLFRPLALVGETLLSEEDARIGPAFAGFVMAPLRFRLSRVTLSALEVHVASTAPPFGTAVRLQLSLLQVGVLL